MPTFDRTTIVRGPCKVTYGGATFYAKGGVKITQANATFDKETDSYGVVGRGKTDLTQTSEFTPVVEIEALTVLCKDYGPGSLATIGVLDAARRYAATNEQMSDSIRSSKLCLLHPQLT
jgi:hypothetical protein